MEIKEYRKKDKKLLKDFILNLDDLTMKMLTNLDRNTLFWAYSSSKFSIVMIGIENNKMIALGTLASSAKNVFEIRGVVVESSQRKKGYGSQMVSYLLGLARGLGGKKVTLGVFKKNKKAIKFYEDLGFIRYGEEDEEGYLYEKKF